MFIKTRLHRSITLSLLLGAAPLALAEEEWVPVGSAEAAPTAEAAVENDTWADRQHGAASRGLDRFAHRMDGWFGTPDPNNPASASLRIMLDTEWNKYDEFSVKPRIRGRLKLPVLENKVSVVFGDDSLDNQLGDPAHLGADGRQSNNRNRTYDRDRVRDDNTSLALRWSDLSRLTGLDTDFDIGVRSGDDIYARVKAGKRWQLENDYSTFAEQIYRYGIDSKHYARTNFEIRKAPAGKPFIANHLHAQYENDGDKEEWTWGNSLYRQHDFAPGKWLNYGVYAGGYIENKKASINGYGPFVGYRQPFLRPWLFVQTELNYYNDRREDRSHYVGALLRFEALF
ncbi:hypothetical protein LVJ83_11165 [Uruburuella testudinis]|uniref:Porin n=1 Tax=Uruburuella testudinis TaxID=1282863 RepID=A0ABY4DXR6_9NEIS|nr:hypothetical protein [Uruburuella testudinis]UOO81486.1 hypothetical protein LVJ83_11165 [Uruburuella testudinis]